MGLFRAIKAAFRGEHPASAGASPVAGGAGATTAASAQAESNELPLEPRRILFVESDPTVQTQLTSALTDLPSVWTTQIASTAAEALKLLAESSFDAIAPAHRLSDMEGMECLAAALKIRPELTLFMQCAAEDRTPLVKQGKLPPNFLPYPPEPRELLAALERGFQLQRWMTGATVRPLLVRMVNLPAVPSLYARVMRELRSDDPSIEAVGKLIAQDPALTARMLQMVNSPVFALGRPLCEAVDAVTFLGAERTKALILMASLSLHGSLTPCDGFSQESFWQHSLAVATLGRMLALKELKNASLADACFTAGLLHDVGKLLFASNLPRDYSEVIKGAKFRGKHLHDAEIEAFGVSHGQLGASLLGVWGLPMHVLEAIAWHAHPRVSDVPGYSVLTIVHAANILEYEKRGLLPADGAPEFEMEYLTELGLADRLNHWRQLAGCPSRQAEASKAVAA